MPVREALESHLRGMGTPFLFVGSGMSRRYLNTEDWPGLLRTFADKTDHDYDYYRTTAEGDLPAIASAVAEAFHPIWWKKATYSKSRKQWAEQAANQESALKIEVANIFADSIKALPKSGALADEIELLRNAVVDGIITTNYDPLLETLFPEFDVMVGQQDVLFCAIQGIGEIYKIHGSATQPDSLVLTTADYAEFEERSNYLAAKLMTIFVEHPIVFLGYSLNDPNIIAILKSISACLTSDNINQLRDRLIFVQWEKDATPKMESQTLVVLDEIPIPVQHIVVPDFTEIFSALAGINRKFPAQMLRKLKRHVYDLVLTGDPKEQIAVAADLSDTDAADLDVVFGVGIKEKIGIHGYVGLTRADLLADILTLGDYDPHLVVHDVLPQALRRARNVPVFKYLKGAEHLTKDGKIRANADLDQRIVDAADRQRGHLSTSTWMDKKAATKLAGISNLAELIAAKDLKDAMDLVLYLPESKVPVDELRAYILAHPEFAKINETQYVKVVCFLDWLEFGRRS